MSLNTEVFLKLNADADPSPVMQLITGTLAFSPVLLAPILLTCLWVWGDPKRRPALLAVTGALFAGQAVNMLLGMAWYEPRPFMVGVGHTWLVHVADNGFPSDHATLAWSLGLGLLLTKGAPFWGAVACLLGLAAGWARVYLGVHFPIDVLVSIPVGFISALVARLMLPAVKAWVLPLAERLYDAVLDRLPDRFPLPRRSK